MLSLSMAMAMADELQQRLHLDGPGGNMRRQRQDYLGGQE